MIRPKGVTTNYFLISLIPLWLSPVNRPHRAEREKKAGTRAPPPKKSGGVACDPDSGTESPTVIRPHAGSLSSLFIPAGRLGAAPRRER